MLVPTQPVYREGSKKRCAARVRVRVEVSTGIGVMVLIPTLTDVPEGSRV